jgi:hypothetical protein
MRDSPGSETTDLSDVLLAMDVVDTLRHEEVVLQRELGRDERDVELVEKVKKMYAAQGIEVSDAVVAEGVAALREERFVYRPPEPGFQHRLAKLYVQRSTWAKRGLFLLIALIACYAVYQLAFIAPHARSRSKELQALNHEIEQQQDRIQVALDRTITLQRTLNALTAQELGQRGAVVHQTVEEARQRLTAAEDKIQSFQRLVVDAELDAASAAEEGEALRRRVNLRAELIEGLDDDLAAAERAVAAIGELAGLPEKLASQRESIIREARGVDARRQAEELFADAMAFVDRGDVEDARQGLERLQQLYSQVVQEYELRIVSRPGEPSGVWRVPEDKPGVENYYLIVEAVTPRGEILTVPVTSEEDGETRDVTKWGMRVDADIFEAVRRDKQNDGIIDNRRFGVKQRGDLLPTYLLPTTGGAITEW